MQVVKIDFTLQKHNKDTQLLVLLFH